MQPAAQQCNAQMLQQSLNDALTEQQEELLAIHLNDCADCRLRLEQLATGGDENWHRISAVLRQEARDAGPTRNTSDVVPQLKMKTCSRVDPTFIPSRRIAPVDFAVDFLQPSTDVDSIGQLAEIQIKAVIGHGGNGIVLKGVQPELNRLVAVKVMAPHLATSAAARQRFAREAQATAAIVHPSVMPILSVNSSGQLPFLVMPYVDCESLQQRLDRSGALPVVDILRIGLQVARGLQAAHAQGLVHRDVKPANILLERGVDRVMLTDFGLARAVDDASLTRTGLIAGTPQYMSPEQARGDTLDTRSDLFSLGSVLYAMSTGRPPFRAETSYGILRRVTDETPRPICELNPDLPSWLEGIISRLLSKSAADRFGSADDLAELLEDCLAHVQQPNAIPLPAAAKTLARRPRAWSARGSIAAAIAIPSLAMCGVLMSQLHRQNETVPKEQTATHIEQKSNHPEALLGEEQLNDEPSDSAIAPQSTEDDWLQDPGNDLETLRNEISRLLNDTSEWANEAEPGLSQPDNSAGDPEQYQEGVESLSR